MAPARYDVVPNAQSAPYKDRRACYGCRLIKSKCMVRPGESSCSRCDRLNIECFVPQHRRGMYRSDSNEGRRQSGMEDQSREAARSSSSSIDHTSRRKTGSVQQRDTGSSKSRDLSTDAVHASMTSEDTGASKSPYNYSVESMLLVEERTEPNRIGRNTTLLSSTAFTTFQSQEQAVVETSEVVYPPEPEGDPFIVHPVAAGILDEEEVVRLIEFYYEKLNPIIALLDPVLYDERMLNSPCNAMLLMAICTVSSKFILPNAHKRCQTFIKQPLAELSSQDVAPRLEYVHALSILAMWKHPQDGSSWRKVRLATTMAIELGLDRAFQPVKLGQPTGRARQPPSRKQIQRQRTLLQLACFEDGYRDQRGLALTIDANWLPEPAQWIEWLGDAVQDIDIRLAASRANAIVRQNLVRQIRRSSEYATTSRLASRSVAFERIQMIEMSMAAETANSALWREPHLYGLGCGKRYSGFPCLLFHSINTTFNYQRALYAVYTSAAMADVNPPGRQHAFVECGRLACELFELIASGPFGKDGYYRYVHDIVILNLAVAAVWIDDNFDNMPFDLASRAVDAVRAAAAITRSSLKLSLEHGSHLARFLQHCARNLRVDESTISGRQAIAASTENSPILPAHESLETLSGPMSNFWQLSGDDTVPVGRNRRSGSMCITSNHASAETDQADSIVVDPTLQYIQDIFMAPCVNFEHAEGHNNIMSFFSSEDNNGPFL